MATTISFVVSKKKEGDTYVYDLSYDKSRDYRGIATGVSFSELCILLKMEAMKAIPKGEMSGDQLSPMLDRKKLKNPPFVRISATYYASGMLGSIRHYDGALTQQEIELLLDYINR